MSGGYRNGQPPTDLAELIEELDDIDRRISILEGPTGEQTYQTVAKLSALVSNIQAQLDAWVATRWTNAQVQSAIDSSISSNNAALSAGPTTMGGVSLSGGFVFTPNGYNYDITYTRRTLWIGNDGRVAWASSSARKKAGIKPADETRLLALLDIVPKSFIYRAELSRRTNLRINEGVDYTPKREIGLIAEELDAAGLREFVNYAEDGVTPEGIEYGMLVVALLAIDRAQRDEITALRVDVDALKAAAG